MATVAATLTRTKRANKLALLRQRQHAKKLNQELNVLRARYDGLVGEVIDAGIDYAQILEIRNTFYKCIRQAPLSKYADPVAKLELYKRLTKQYHNEFLARQVVYAGHEDVGLLRETENQIARVTYRLIDLSNHDKNGFVTTMKRIREIRHL